MNNQKLYDLNFELVMLTEEYKKLINRHLNNHAYYDVMIVTRDLIVADHKSWLIAVLLTDYVSYEDRLTALTLEINRLNSRNLDIENLELLALKELKETLRNENK